MCPACFLFTSTLTVSLQRARVPSLDGPSQPESADGGVDSQSPLDYPGAVVVPVFAPAALAAAATGFSPRGDLVAQAPQADSRGAEDCQPEPEGMMVPEIRPEFAMELIRRVLVADSGNADRCGP